MLREPEALALCLVLAALRTWRVRSLLALPAYRGPDWFFDAHVPEHHPARPRLVRQYRAWTIWPALLVEAIALADVLTFATLAHVAFVHGPLTWALAAFRRVVLRNFLLRARDLAAPAAGAKRVSSLRPRLLRDVSSPLFEVANGAAVAVALALIARSGQGSLAQPAAIVLYFQLGAVLWKASLLRRPIPLPAERSQDYLRLVDEATRAALRSIDQVRAATTGVLGLVAARAAFGAAFERHADAIVLGTLAAVVLLALAMLVAQARFGRRLLGRAREFAVPAGRPPLADPENLMLGGLAYRNADNPAVVVDGGPLRFAVNVLNKVTWFYVAWWLGLAVLLAQLALGA